MLQQLSSSSFSHRCYNRENSYSFSPMLHLRGFIFIFFDVLQPRGFISIFFDVLQHPSSSASLTCFSSRHHLHLRRVAATIIIFILTYVALGRIYLHLLRRVTATIDAMIELHRLSCTNPKSRSSSGHHDRVGSSIMYKPKKSQQQWAP